MKNLNNNEMFAKFAGFELTAEEAKQVRGGDGLASGITGGNGDGGSGDGSGGNQVEKDCYVWIREKDGLHRYHETESRAIQLALQNGGVPSKHGKQCY